MHTWLGWTLPFLHACSRLVLMSVVRHGRHSLRNDMAHHSSGRIYTVSYFKNVQRLCIVSALIVHAQIRRPFAQHVTCKSAATSAALVVELIEKAAHNAECTWQ